MKHRHAAGGADSVSGTDSCTTRVGLGQSVCDTSQWCWLSRHGQNNRWHGMARQNRRPFFDPAPEPKQITHYLIYKRVLGIRARSAHHRSTSPTISTTDRPRRLHLHNRWPRRLHLHHWTASLTPSPPPIGWSSLSRSTLSALCFLLCSGSLSALSISQKDQQRE